MRALFASLALMTTVMAGVASAQQAPSAPAFPIGVWLQNPALAPYYRALGVNTYVGLWQGPTEAQLAILAEHGMRLVGQQTEAALKSTHKGLVTAWLHMDEPDNAQRVAPGVYGPCVPPEEVVRRADEMRARDATRPVFLNFGQGVAHRTWKGRGSCTGDWDYYPKAARAADIVSFDIYPVATPEADVHGRLEFVALGVANLRTWTEGRKPIWAIIETTHIHNSARRPVPAEVRAEVLMALAEGARGIVYFVHEWKPTFSPAALFRYPDVAAEVGRINRLLTDIGPSLAFPSGAAPLVPAEGQKIAVAAFAPPGAWLAIVSNLQAKPARATLNTPISGAGTAMLLGEDRAVPVVGGKIILDLAPYGAHVVRVAR